MRGVLAAVSLATGLAAVVAGGLLGQWAGIKGGIVDVAGMLFVEAGPIQKLIMMVVTLAALSAIVVAMPGLLKRAPLRDGDVLTLVGWGTPLLGLLGALEGAISIYRAMQRVGPVDFIVIAPSVAEVIFTAGLGMLAGGVALGLHAVAAARVRPA